MNNEDLKKLGLTDEQVKGVMVLKGELIKQEQAKAQADLDAKTAEVNNLSLQIANRDKDIKALKKSSEGNEELSKQLTELQGKYKADTESLEAQLNQTRFDSVLNEALSKTKARDVKDIKALLNADNISLSDDGKLIGLDEQISTLQEQKSYLFDLGKGQAYSPNGGQSTKYSSDLATAMKQGGDDFNLTNWIKEQGEN
ncbi:phage capsid protein [Lactococcus lactis]|uniref:Phage capsid protein n=1 Tax=Lactococcus lactis TaxID=1358 RepID=A0A6B3RUZ0_9LACT|nr:phage scaffolding protein [Lactococcus lactis]MCT1174160.1 phage capsid protein [Lactococcus lactis]MCT1186495.1 phage capsid protein [Lactococcus lactis]MCT1189559.1 phage capsid protein [Lactococcus lactis]MCT1195265.1 phage capsid protein [Lactococcus lactis]NEX49353.1 phage capsid protein [Lactococcus lactis]